MSLKNRVYFGALCLGLGWALIACAPIHPEGQPTTEAPASARQGDEPPVSSETMTTTAQIAPLGSSERWINQCDTEAVDGGEITFAMANNAMAGRTWLNNGMTNEPFIFSQLTDLSIADGTTIMPDVAESWDLSDDGLVYTYHLRHDVLWHDGQPLSAADVKWTIELYSHPDSEVEVLSLLPLSAISGTKEFTEGSADEISGVQTPDEYTVEITLLSPHADFLYGLSGMNLWPKHYFEGMSFKEISTSPKVREQVIGSGPFKMAAYVPGQEYVLEANQAYFKGKPHLDRLHFRLDLLGSASWLPGLDSGEIQVGGIVEDADRQRVEENPDLVIVGDPLPGATAIWPNHKNLPDKRVLQALLYAIDRDTIAAFVYGPGQAVVFDYNNLDPHHLWTAPDMAQYRYDPEKAQELLVQAGWDPNHELSFITYAKTEVDKNVIAAMQQYWAAVGVKVNVEFMEEADWLQSIFANLDYDLAYGCCGIALPYDYPNYSCANVPPDGVNTAAYCNTEVDKMVSDAMTQSDPAKRQELWYQIGAVTNDEMLELRLFQLDSVQAVNRNVCNFQFRQWSDSVWPERNPETWFLRPAS